jgi:hypothetical protein
VIAQRREALNKLILTAIVACFAQMSVSANQIGYAWTFSELTSRSDVVVIAAWVRTADTGMKTTITENISPGLPAVEMNADFKVLTVFKGNGSLSPITLVHYRLDMDRIRGGCINCGTHLDFENGAVYLLFLKQDPDGRYRPTSGQVFPDSSVMVLPKNGVSPYQ